MIMLMEIVICSVVANTVLKYRSRCWWFLVIVVLDNVGGAVGDLGYIVNLLMEIIIYGAMVDIIL